MRQLLLILACAAQTQNLLAPAPAEIVIHVTICHDDTNYCRATIAKWQRSQDERELMPLLTEDFRNLDDRRGELNKALRDRIAVIAERLAKNRYD